MINPKDVTTDAPAGHEIRRGFYFNAGFFTQSRVRRIVELAGYELKLGKPSEHDDVLVWGHSPYAARGEKVAEATNARLVRVEDAFLRSLFPGRAGEPPIGLSIDRKGAFFDSRQASELEDILANHPLDDTALLNRARDAALRMRQNHLTKYAAVDPDIAAPAPGYVLVIDQTRGDASIRLGGANADSFREMLYWAQEDFPAARILIKTHPETREGHREGHFSQADCSDRISLFDQPISPWVLMEGAVAVYTVSSQLGFEAILAEHKPVTFGQPFYAGWGLTDDRQPLARRKRKLSRAQLVAGSLILYPHWYDPHADRLCGLEDVLSDMEAMSRTWREDHKGHVALGMRAWKRGHLHDFFGSSGRSIHFSDSVEDGIKRASETGRSLLVWSSRLTDEVAQAAQAADVNLIRVEDGFLRSRGLGADLVPPLSLVTDDLGIYYDPTRESRLERLIAEASKLPETRLLRAERVIARLKSLGVTKYNTGTLSDLPETNGKQVVLVPGQVEDDASIKLGASDVSTNQELLETARRLCPKAFVIYKPHPDVEAGLRKGEVPDEALARLADHVASNTEPASLIDLADKVVTMTSGLGFEALIRGKSVVTLGTPFYAGWGLTKDLGPVPARRQARPNLAALVHATLIAYPRYFDPVTGSPCSVEVAIDRLVSGEGQSGKRSLRVLAKLQGWLKGHAWLWRR